MRKERVKEFLKSKKVITGCAAVAMALIIGGVAIREATVVPELPSYTDPAMEVSIEDEETPLASKPTTTTKTKTSKKTSKSKVTLKKAATKTYTKKLPTTKKTTSKTTTKSTSTQKQTIKTQTTVKTATTEKYTKKSKKKVVTKVVTTTVKTTTTTTPKTTTATQSTTDTKTATVVSTTAKTGKYTVDVAKVAPLMDSRIISAYKKLGFTLSVDSSVSYAGHFDAATQSIVLQREDDTIYHELGHFLAFIAGNVDTTSSFKNIYLAEKSAFAGVNKAYATQNSSEYFAESVKDYVLNPASLKATRPQTYTAIKAAFDKITDAQVSKVLAVYGPFWAG